MNDHGMSAFGAEIAAKVRGLVAESDKVTQTVIAEALGRSQGYVSPRMNGKEGWTTFELETIAGLLGMTAPQFLAEIMNRGDFTLAAQTGEIETGETE